MGNRSKVSVIKSRLDPSDESASFSGAQESTEPQAKRKRLLARWTGNLMRTFGGSASAADRPGRTDTDLAFGQHHPEVVYKLCPEPLSAHSTLAKPKTEKQTQRSPLRFCRWPGAGTSTDANRKRPRTWFVKSLSSSTSTLRAQSSGATDEPASNGAACGSSQPAAPSSPYKQLAKALARLRRASSSQQAERGVADTHLPAPTFEHGLVSATLLFGGRQQQTRGSNSEADQELQPSEQPAHDKRAKTAQAGEIRYQTQASPGRPSNEPQAQARVAAAKLVTFGERKQLPSPSWIEAADTGCVRTGERESAKPSCLSGQEVEQKSSDVCKLFQQQPHQAASAKQLKIQVDEHECYANKPDRQRNTDSHEPHKPGSPSDESEQVAGQQTKWADPRRLLSLIQPLASPDSLSDSTSSVCSSLAPSSALVSTPRSATAEPKAWAPMEPPQGDQARPASQPVCGHNLFAGQPTQEAESRSSAHQSRPTSSSGVGTLKSNLKQLVKRQQSVDSYRMARDLMNKLKRQQDQSAPGNRAHQSSEAIKANVGAASHATQETSGRKLSLLIGGSAGQELLSKASTLAPSAGLSECQIRVSAAPKRSPHADESAASEDKRQAPMPPNTLSLLPANQPGSFVVGSFSGCITPTYPTHHLPSPKYVSSAMLQAQAKKYSNASTVSSSLGAQESQSQSAVQPASFAGPQPKGCGGLLGGATNGAAPGLNQSDTESSLGGSVTPSRASRLGGAGDSHSPAPAALSYERSQSIVSAAFSLSMSAGLPAQSSLTAAEEAARRVELAEHIYDNKCGLGEEMKFLASFPELCDITFLVGETREPVCAVKSVLAARSRVFHKILFGNRIRRIARQRNQYNNSQASRTMQSEEQAPDGELSAAELDPALSRANSSSPKQVLASKSSSPLPPTKSSSPSQQQWSVTLDAGGFSTGQDSTEGYPSGSAKAGRVSSLASRGRGESMASLTSSMGSQQPLIIGPGQTAAPAKRNKKAASRTVTSSGLAEMSNQSPAGSSASRLRSMFMKRASDPSIKQRQSSDSIQTHLASGDQSYLDKMSSSQMSTTMIIEEFEPDVFRQLIEYMHTGCVLLQARTLLGLLNAADYYGLEQLRRACLRFVSCCITVDTVCSLLSTAERYIQYKCTKSIVQKVLEFVDTHADEIFKLNAFGLLPEHVVRLILARDGLQADEQVKYNGVYTWCEHYCRSHELTNIADVMRDFLDLIQFHKIPRDVLLSKIYPSRIVPDNIFLSALAYQADPHEFEPAQPAQARRMTLPNPIIDSDGATLDESDSRLTRHQRQTTPDRRAKRKQSELSAASDLESQQARHQAKQSIWNRPRAPATGSQLANDQARQARHAKLRKGSIAQVSISSVMRLSHKLSIKKRHSNLIEASSSAETRRRRNSAATSVSALFRTNSRAQTKSSSGSKNLLDKTDSQRDPLQVGQQILNDYLERQRQREADEFRANQLRQTQLEFDEQQAVVCTDRKLSGATASAHPESSRGDQQALERQQLAKSISSTSRKSFRDFKHISKRLFMRHSSSRLVQSPVADAIVIAAPSTVTTSEVACTPKVFKPGQSLAQTSSLTFAANDQPSGLGLYTGETLKDKRRKLFKIKRSETVVESSSEAPNVLPSHQTSSCSANR